MAEVSVIIPVYRVENYIKKCLDSLINQTFEDFELILIDDGSPDRSGEICDAYAKKDKRIKVIHQENQGSAIARNNGLAAAIGKYVYFCDPDDYIEENLLGDNIDLANKYDANLVIFGYYEEDLIKQKDNLLPMGPPNTTFFASQEDFRNEFESLYSINIMYTLWNKLYKREFLLNNDCYFKSMSIGEDTLFNYSVYKNVSRVFTNDKHYYHYVVQRPGSAISTYRKDKFTLRYKESSELENLIQHWGNVDKFQSLIFNDWLITLLVGVKNLFHSDCPFDDKRKKEEIKYYTKMPKIQYVLNQVSAKQFSGTFKFKIKKYLLKNIQKRYVYYVFKSAFYLSNKLKTP